MIHRLNIFPASSKSDKVVLFSVLGLAVALRALFINWGLPDLYEEATPLRIVTRFFNLGGNGFLFNPQFFNYPALTFYLQFVIQLLHYAIGHVAGVYPTLQAFSSSVTAMVTIARLTGVLFDTGTVLIVYIFAKEFIDNRTALLAALICALNPLHIQHAHFIEVDTPLTFFCMLSILFIFRILTNPTTKNYLLTGIFIGLAAATKYTGAFLLPVLIFSHAMRSTSLREAIESFRDSRIYKSLSASIVVFLLFNPYILLDFQQFKKDFSFEQFHVSYGHLGIDPSQSSLMFYLGEMVNSTYGIILSVIVAGAIISYLINHKKIHALLLLFPVLYFIIISTWEMRADRYILPIIPILCIIGAEGIVGIHDRIQSYSRNKFAAGSARQGKIILALVICGCLIQPVLSTAKFLASFTVPDTRTVTKKWIQQNIPAGSVIATGPFGVEFSDSAYRTFSIPFLAVECERVAPFYDTRWYEDLDLLITSSYDRDRYFKEPKKYADFLPFYDSLKTRWKLFYEIVPKENQNGPSFWLYKFSDSVHSQTFDSVLFQRLYTHPESTRISLFLNELSRIEFHKGRFEKSGQLLNEILSVEVNNYPIRNRFAQVLYNLGNYTGALNQLQISLQLNPNQADALALAGSALIRINQGTAAEGVLRRSIQLNPSNDLPYEELIRLYTEMHDKPKLLNILDQYLKVLPPIGERTSTIKNIIQQVERLP
jgi:4-amino-4-deoxy-L-arabinose transferase-like glycosyltransferase/tetratricopeptide (TPR) repeat protein